MSNIFEKWCETATPDRAWEISHIQMNKDYIQRRLDEGVDHFICGCGKPQMDDTLGYKDLKERGLCFDCNFWKIVLATEATFIVGQNAYIDGGNRPDISPLNKQFLGFGGTLWKFKRSGSEVVEETNNLYHRGTVPDRFYEGDTAEFIKET